MLLATHTQNTHSIHTYIRLHADCYAADAMPAITLLPLRHDAFASRFR